MKEAIKSSPSKPKLHDKKNYAMQGADENIISANNSNANSITISNEKQSKINETMKFFNMLFDGIPAGHFSYLMTFTTGYGVTYSFAISDQTQREAMAYKAVELSEYC